MNSFQELLIIYRSREAAAYQFERLCTYLLKAEHPETHTIRPYPGDGGVDFFIGDWDSLEGIHVYQVKFFPNSLGDSQKEQIRRSFKTAVSNSNFKVKTWTLCLPIDLSAEEIKWWQQWKRKNSAFYRVEVNELFETDLQYKLSKPENSGLKDAIFNLKTPLQERQVQFLRKRVNVMSRNFLENVRVVVLVIVLAAASVFLLLELLTGSWLPTNLAGLVFTTVFFIIFIAILLRFWGLLIHDAISQNEKYEWFLGNIGGVGRFAFPVADGSYEVCLKSAPCIFNGCLGTAYVYREMRKSKSPDEKVETTSRYVAACDRDRYNHYYLVDNNDLGYPQPLQL